MSDKEKEDDRMRRAYGTAGRAYREKLSQERPEDEAELASIEPAEVIAVHGLYDHIHRVLEATGVPFLGLDPGDLPRVDWDRMQVLFVNCPGHLPETAMNRIAPWVRAGGYLVTTDWALKHVVEPLFPGTVRHNGQTTDDCVVRVMTEDGETDPLLQGFLEQDRDPLWWLEGSSYPIEVLDTERVRVLVRSKELADQWGQEPVVVTFEEGEGTVLHLLSHLYLQRSETRDARDAMAPADYFQAELGLAGEEAVEFAKMADGLDASDLRAAMSKGRIMSNVVLSSMRKARERMKRRGGSDEEGGAA
jgi:hypothetical protein